MTMQVGMIGTDGIVLASDTLWTLTGDIRQTFNSSKIKVNCDRGLAISCSRNMETSTEIADKIIANLCDTNISCDAIEQIAENVLNPIEKFRRDIQCLIVSLCPRPRLFRLRKEPVDGFVRPVCQEMLDKAIAGDDHNPAIFWAERHYQRRSFKELILLAAHLVTIASKLNSGTIGGLEVVVCDDSGIRRLTDESNRELESKSLEIDEQLQASFATYSQQFTYAPNMIG